MSRRPIIFIAGIHGAGKGTLTACLSSHFGFEAFSASELIKLEKGRPVDVSKIAIDPDENQDYLVASINRISSKGDRILLDGHFVLMSESGYFEVPESVFRNLSIELVVLKVHSADIVAQRLFERDGQCADATKLSHLQCIEEKRAREISRSLEIPLIITEGDDYDGVISELENILRA